MVVKIAVLQYIGVPWQYTKVQYRLAVPKQYRDYWYCTWYSPNYCFSTPWNFIVMDIDKKPKNITTSIIESNCV